MEKLLKQRVEILAQEVEKMKAGGAGDGYTKQEADAKFLSKDDASAEFAAKQDSLDQTQLEAVNSGINSTKVAQIEINKTNILYALENGASNLLKIIRSDSSEAKVQDDGSVVFNHAAGTATYIHLFVDAEGDGYKLLPESWKGKYLSGIITNTTDFELQMEFSNNGTSWAGSISLTEANQKKQIPSSYTYYRITIRMYNTTSLSNYVIKPMIADELVYNAIGAGQPPALPNYDLTRLEAEDRAALAEEIDAGAKNLLQNTGTTTTISDVTFTVNSDGSVSTYGTSTAGNMTFEINQSFTFKSGTTYVLSGCPTGGSPNGYRLCTMGTTYMDDYGNDNGSVNVGDNSSRRVAIYIKDSGTNMGTQDSPKVFKPMISTKAAFDVSKKFVPYRPSYQELYEMVLALQTTRTTTTRKTTSKTTKTNEE